MPRRIANENAPQEQPKKGVVVNGVAEYVPRASSSADPPPVIMTDANCLGLLGEDHKMINEMQALFDGSVPMPRHKILVRAIKDGKDMAAGDPCMTDVRGTRCKEDKFIGDIQGKPVVFPICVAHFRLLPQEYKHRREGGNKAKGKKRKTAPTDDAALQAGDQLEGVTSKINQLLDAAGGIATAMERELAALAVVSNGDKVRHNLLASALCLALKGKVPQAYAEGDGIMSRGFLAHTEARPPPRRLEPLVDWGKVNLLESSSEASSESS